MATQAEVRDLIARIRRTGYKVTKSGTKHYKVLKPNGAVLQDDKGVVIISGTPSDVRWREMTVQRLLAAGVFSTDPYKASPSGTPGKKGAHQQPGDNDDEGKKSEKDVANERRRQAISRAAQSRSEEHRVRTRAVRSRVEPIVVKLGGWNEGRGLSSSGVSLTEFARVMFHWAVSRGRVELPVDSFGARATLEAATQAIGLLRKPDSTLGSRWLPLLEVFVDELQREAGSPPDPKKAADRYREILKESKGVAVEPPAEEKEQPPGAPPAAPPVGSSAGAGTPAARTPIRVAPRPVHVDPPLGPLYAEGYVEPPALALEVLFHMATDGNATTKDAIIDLATKVAELEQNSPEAKEKRRKTE